MSIRTVSLRTVSYFVILFSLTGYLSYSLSSHHSKFTPPRDDLSVHWHPDLFRILTFGHAPAAVDFLLIRFLAENNIEHVKPGVKAKVFYYLDLATEIDPAFFALYTAGTSFLVVARNDKESALALITKGEKFRKYQLIDYPEEFRETFWSQPWQIPMIKGYIHLFEFNDLPGATESYLALNTMSGVPDFIRETSERFARSGGIYEVGMNVLRGMILTSTDPEIKRELEKKRESLFLSQYLYQLNDSFKKFKGSWSKFKQEHRVPDQDLWGGKIYLTAEGKIDSTTPRQKVLGLE